MPDAVEPGLSPEEVHDWSVHTRSAAALGQSDGSLYHYTDVRGLKGILDSAHIWGTHVAYLNDSQEFSYGMEAICAMIEQHGQEVESPVRSSTILGLCRNVLRTKDVLEEDVGPFVTCFSMFGDELSQWRGYANGGYAIRFDSAVMEDSVRQATVAGDLPISAAAPTPELHPVEYLPAKQGARVAQLVDEHVEELIDAAKIGAAVDLRPAHQRLLRHIIPLAASMKHRKFVGEAEQRLISHTSETFYSASRIGLVPRVRFEFDRSAVTGVLVGPSEHCDVKELSLYRYLRRNYPGAEVIRSNVPYRDI
ncbi:DUF2971 domain-containing protein [Mycobacterium angelicum]|uniref:DUF2971 domain-containing protein n=1 Tax=Mycobacterium angelicum TaxID=470074 RepID=UPI001B8040C6|nr:DUF2971 domain-containing protein [Mycobacterium angelicum]MCV7195953.1 hypothetical protein [Mycobacterium angelicum]